ncbi:Poly (3-hydroxybutyrate) depolymerase (fragment) [Cupriavidus necator]|uniref:Poly (3-hydroxybutyrate) depolymerase n=1 Tax=Cupriavidus necator TaxID=106590 RepID=A0A1K0IG95_CUPNE
MRRNAAVCTWPFTAASKAPRQRQFVEHAGYNRWADTNDIVVLYPQTVASAGTPFNPKGCWDWWGYTDPEKWGTKAGVQLSAVRGMVERLASRR